MLSDTLFYVFDFAFDFWPFLTLVALKDWSCPVRNMLIAWAFWAAIRVLLFLNPDPSAVSLLLPEPLNTVLFFVAGAILGRLHWPTGFWSGRGLRRETDTVQSVDDLQELTAREFEDMVVELHETLGHRAKHVGTTGDHGVDIIVHTRVGERCIVQCKRWRSKVGEPVIRDFYGVLHHEKADRGAIFTTGQFTRQAREWARGKPIRLYDGEEFLKLWKWAQARRKREKNRRHATQ